MGKTKKIQQQDLFENVRKLALNILQPLKDHELQMFAYLDEVVSTAQDVIKNRKQSVIVIPKTPTAKKKRKVLPSVPNTRRVTRQMMRVTMQSLDCDEETSNIEKKEETNKVKFSKSEKNDNGKKFQSFPSTDEKTNSNSDCVGTESNQSNDTRKTDFELTDDVFTSDNTFSYTKNASNEENSFNDKEDVKTPKANNNMTNVSESCNDTSTSNQLEDECDRIENNIESNNSFQDLNIKNSIAKENLANETITINSPSPRKRKMERSLTDTEEDISPKIEKNEKKIESSKSRKTRSKMKQNTEIVSLKQSDNTAMASPLKRKQEGDGVEDIVCAKTSKIVNEEESSNLEIRCTRSKSRQKIDEASKPKPVMKQRLNHYDPRSGQQIHSFLQPSKTFNTPDRLNILKQRELKKKQELEMKEDRMKERSEYLNKKKQIRMEEMKRLNAEKQLKARERRQNPSPSTGRLNQQLLNKPKFGSAVKENKTKTMDEEEINKKKLEEAERLEEIKKKREEHRKRIEIKKLEEEAIRKKQLEEEAAEAAKIAAEKQAADEKLAKFKLDRQMNLSQSFMNKTTTIEIDANQSINKADISSYDMHDLDTDAESDNEDNPKHKCPSWIQKGFKIALLKQKLIPEKDINEYWGEIKSPEIHKVFSRVSMSFHRRTSSACWDSPILYEKR